MEISAERLRAIRTEREEIERCAARAQDV